MSVELAINGTKYRVRRLPHDVGPRWVFIDAEDWVDGFGWDGPIQRRETLEEIDRLLTEMGQ